MSVFGAEVLEAKPIPSIDGTGSSGTISTDGFTKIWPRGLGLDSVRADRMGDFLTKLLDLATQKYGVEAIDNPGDGGNLQMQVLNYRPGRNAGSDGGDCGFKSGPFSDCERRPTDRSRVHRPSARQLIIDRMGRNHFNRRRGGLCDRFKRSMLSVPP